MSNDAISTDTVARRPYFDYALAAIVICIVIFGMVMVYSTSSYKAELLYGDSAYFLKRQMVFALVALIFMYIISRIDYMVFARFAKAFLLISMVLLVLVYIIGKASHGSSRWIYIGSFGFQPSELTKVALIIYMADAATRHTKSLNSFKGLMKLMLLPIIAVVLIAIENLSTAIICFVIVGVIAFVASPRYSHFIILMIIGIAGAVIFILTAGYRAERIRVWLHPEDYDTGYQTIQSLYAIGSGGLFGRGLGNSIQKLGFIPESHNDMIFSVICEELGLVGALCVIVMFVALIYRITVIGMNTPERFGGLITVGVMAHVASQVIINIGVVTNTIPPTGVTLPFISYGGSSIVFILLEMGLVLSVARQIKTGR